MPSCLGLYIEDNLIKYAKVSKDNGVTKVDAFGIKFIEKTEEAIKQIIAETFSYKVPISINSTSEKYDYFSFISLLNKKDLKKVIETNFDAECEEKGQSTTAFETRYDLVNDLENKEKIRVIHIAAGKAEINRKKSWFENAKLSCIAPLPMTISNLVSGSENIMIINIEEKTTLTTIIGQKVYNVETIDVGAKQILDKIEEKENSYAKAYEICKNTTIYTSDASDLQIEENEYLQYIMPTLYTIAEKTTEVINNSLQKIDKVYITGTMAVINNIDIYFEQYLTNVDCKILKPNFIKENIGSVNIKDYIEVNSAIALAIQGLGEGLKTMNFITPSLKDRLPEWMKIEIGGQKNKENKEAKHKEKTTKFKFNNDFNNPLTKLEKNLARSLGSVFLLLIVYTIFSIVLQNQINGKSNEISISEGNMETKISSINNDISTLTKKIGEYTNAIENIKKLNEERAENLRNKNAIPILLTQIMNTIPQEAQITSIQNTENKHIAINIQANNYEYIGYFIAKIKADTILTNVVSNSGQKQDGIVKVTIEGELP